MYKCINRDNIILNFNFEINQYSTDKKYEKMILKLITTTDWFF